MTKSRCTRRMAVCAFFQPFSGACNNNANNVNILKAADQWRIHTSAAACSHAQTGEEYITDWKIAKSLKLAIDPNFMQLRNTASKQAVSLQKECALVYGACQHMIRGSAEWY